MYTLTFDMMYKASFHPSEALSALVQDLSVTTRHLGKSIASGWPAIEFTGEWSQLALVADRYTTLNSVNVDEDRLALITRIKSVKEPGRVDTAINRVRKYLTEFATLGGLDHDIIHVANYAQLRVCDLNAILDSLKN